MKNCYKMILVVLVICYTFGIALAQETSAPSDDSGQIPGSEDSSGQGMGSSLTLELTADPGQVLKQSFSVTNAKNQTVLIYPGVLDFEVVGKEGSVQFTNTFNAEHGLSSWLKFMDSSYTVEGGKSKNIEFEIDVPKDAVPGGHWAMLVFKSVDPNDQTKELNQSFVLATVTVKGGDEKPVLHVESIHAEKNSSGKGLDVFVEFSNTSSQFVKPKGKITIYNTWNKKVGEYDIRDVSVFPHVVANIIDTWETNLRIGWYKIEFTGYYGPDNTEIKAVGHYIVWPWQVHLWKEYKFWIIGIIAGLICLVLIIRFIRNYRFQISMRNQK